MIIQSSFNQNAGCWEVFLSGELDIAAKEMFKQELERIYSEQEAHIVLVAEELMYIDSSGLSAIIGILGKMKGNEHTITVQRPRDNVRKLLKITGLDQILLLKR